MRPKDRAWTVAAALLGLLPACSGGGGSGGGAPAALAGQWMVWMTFSGQEIGPYASCMTQSGNTLGGVGLTGSVSGGSFTVTNGNLSGLEVVFAGNAAGNQASGTITITGTALTGTFRMTSFAPAGTLDMAGSLSGVATVASATTASGRREYSDEQRTQLTDVEVAFDDGAVRTHLTFGANGFGLGTHPVGAGGRTVVLSYETATATVEATATGGSVVVSRYDGNGMAGTYTLTFAGGAVSGAFDVDWDLDAYQPS